MEFFRQIEGLISSKISVFKTAFALFSLEVKLAGLSVFPLVLNILMLFVVLITAWSSVILLLGYFAFLICKSFILSLVFTLLVNFGLLFGLVKYLSINLNYMSFEKTREFLSQNESTDYAKLEKTDQRTDCKDEQPTPLSQ